MGLCMYIVGMVEYMEEWNCFLGGLLRLLREHACGSWIRVWLGRDLMACCAGNNARIILKQAPLIYNSLPS
jgi:hypothetical protein